MRLGLSCVLLALSLCATGAVRADVGDDTVVQAREALRKKDRTKLAVARDVVQRINHPLAGWVEYWELLNRLDTAQQSEFSAFAARWSDTYVEDRLRNDWLLELGRRRDWANFRVEYPRFRMNDDREVSCYALLTQHLDGQDVRAAARSAWFAQRELDDGCALLASTLYASGALTAQDAWQEARQSIEFNRPRPARAAAALVGAASERALVDLLDNPARFLARRSAAPAAAGVGFDLELLALMRMAANEPESVAAQLEGVWGRRLPVVVAATAWAHAGKQAALKQLPQAADYARRAWQLWDAAGPPGTLPPWSDDLLAWQVRAALRLPAGDGQRWALALRAIDAMSATEQRESTWTYWRARAEQGLAKPGPEGDAQRASSRAALQALAQQLGFYGQLAAEDLGLRPAWPAPPQPITSAEREASRQRPGFARAYQLIALGLRSEGVREWNYTLRGMGERELLAAAQGACEREVWDRCISASERTRAEIDMAQRFPTPYREQVAAKAGVNGLDPAVLFGLIRQESRFVTDARSGVGASGLMQIMPATAKWTAGKIGFEYRAHMINDQDVNLHLGAAYLKRVLDSFDGSLALAAAAYNAGPGRPRRWRDGPAVEAAAWAESIPFNETREYVKKVLSNSVYYAAVLGQPIITLKARLGGPVRPREAGATPPERDLP